MREGRGDAGGVDNACSVGDDHVVIYAAMTGDNDNGVSGADAAQELGLSVAAVYVAKSRVLQRIRQEAEGLID